MIKFDRIKLLTKANYVSWMCPKLVNSATRPNTINQKHPFNLFMHLRPDRNEAIIEFSAKILLDEYVNLISADTIRQCFENIIELGYCSMDIDNILIDSKILSCDVTLDIEGISLPENFRQILISNLNNVSTFTVQKYLNCGYSVSNMLKTKHLKVRLSIYNKLKEMQTAPNRGFLKMCSRPENLLEYFKGKFRIETNFRNFKQINEFCGTKDNRLMDVLNSNRNPLLSIFDKIFTLDKENSPHSVNENHTLFDFDSINQLRDALLLKECGNDIKLVVEVLNSYYSPKTNKRKYIKDYKKILNALPKNTQSRMIIGCIRDKLSA